MKPTVKELGEEYTAAMRDYLAGQGEAALRRAYEAGRRALAGGMGVLEMAAAHQEAVLSAVRETPGEKGKARALARAMSCFAESLSPFEMVLRGVQESNQRLRHGLRELERAEEQLRRQNEKLAAARDAAENERQRYRKLFEFAPDAYLVTGMDGSIQEANDAAAALLGTAKDRLVGHSLTGFAAEPERDGLAEVLRRIQGGQTERIEDWHVALQPEQRAPFAAAVTVQAERSAAGPGDLRWMIRDVTERRRAEKERTRSLVGSAKAEAARRMEFLAEASAVLVGSLDVEGSLANIARLALPFLGDWCFVHVAQGDGRLRQSEVAFAGEADREFTERLKQGTLFAARWEDLPAKGQIVDPVTAEWCEWAAEDRMHAELLAQFRGGSAMLVPLRFQERPLGMLTFVASPGSRRYRAEDASLGEDLGRRCALALENARLYHEVIAERDKAEKASRAKDEFLAILSHELRNPLMPVIGWTRMLRNHPLVGQDPILSEGVRAMERNAQTLERLVGDCLDLSQISERKIRLERKPVDLNQIIAASVAAVKDLAAAKEIRLTPKLLTEGALLLGDFARLEQVVMNLLVNAVKYTGRAGAITVRCARIEGEAEIEVTDTGAGIDPAFLKQIFEPFRRGSNSWLTHQSGLGLGLAIARQIVEMHGGRIWAESKGVDSGSTFRVRLPMAAIAASEGACELIVIGKPEGRKGIRILVIEDSEDIIFLLKIELEAAGHIVYTALDGKAGLDLAKLSRPDLIISDIKMPGIDGYELIRQIRATPGLEGTPSIALTGFGAKADFERAIAAGFDACVNKPAEPREITMLIGRLTEKRTASRA